MYKCTSRSTVVGPPLVCIFTMLHIYSHILLGGSFIMLALIRLTQVTHVYCLLGIPVCVDGVRHPVSNYNNYHIKSLSVLV